MSDADVMDQDDADDGGLVDAGGVTIADPASEAALIGRLLNSPSDFMSVDGLIGEGDFFDPMHRQLFGAISRKFFADEPVNLESIIGALGGDPRAKINGDQTVSQYVAALMADADGSIDVVDVAQHLQECAERRASSVVDDREFDANLPFASTMGLKMWADQNDPAQELEFLTEDLIPRGETVLIMGESGTGKSFLTFHLAMCMARALPFFGRRVLKPVAVIWFAHEARAGLTARMRAYRKHHNLDLEPLPFAALTRPMPLWPNPDAIDRTIKEIEAIRREYFRGIEDLVIVVDTLNAATPGASEIDSEVVSRIRTNFDRIREATGATLIIVGHTNAAGKHRGNEQLTNNIDTVIVVSRKMRPISAREQVEVKDDDGHAVRMLRVKKQREGIDGEENDFVLHVVEDGTRNKYGKARTSCVVAPPNVADAPAEDQPQERASDRHIGAKVSKQEQMFLQCVIDATGEIGVPPPATLGLPRSLTRVVDYDQVKRLMSNKMLREDDNTEEGRKRHRDRVKTAVKRAREGLMHLKIVGCHDPYIWHTGKPVRGMSSTQPRDKSLFDDRDQPPPVDDLDFLGR